MRTPNGSVEKALKDRTIVGVVDEKDKIQLLLDNGLVATFSQDYRQGADGGWYHEMILAVNGNEIAWR